MSKRKRHRDKITTKPNTKKRRRASSNLLLQIDLGQSFAEYDPCLDKSGAYVNTPALKSASHPERRHCFFVGRRGTGKTATSLFLSRSNMSATQILPMQLVPDDTHGFTKDDFLDTRQRPFKSLVQATSQTLLTEAIRHWLSKKSIGRNSLHTDLTKQLNRIEQHPFDERLMLSFDDILKPLKAGRQKDWLRIVKLPQITAEAVTTIEPKPSPLTICIDRIDEAWDGSDTAVVFLMALMHACIEVTTMTSNQIRPIIFLRENIFERVRLLDNEFSRLETAVVSLDWSPEQLQELIERRINLGLITKSSLGGDTWDTIFAMLDGESSISFVSSFCQHRPRDVLTYCSFAIDAARARNNETVEVADLLAARKRFSDSRLKDLGDEYAENYPNIALVLARFFGLGKTFSVPGVASFIQRLLVDAEVQRSCGSWLNDHTVPEAFADLLYRISFFGISNGELWEFRNAGARSTAAPTITPSSTFFIHPCFHDALHLQDKVIAQLDEARELQVAGVVAEIPDDSTLESYSQQLQDVLDDLNSLPHGKESASQFEEIVGKTIKLCFFRSLTNVQPRSRTADGRSIRDWVCSNTSPQGFWELIRLRYEATQIIWECKNYANLSASDFHQTAYYMNNAMGRCVVVAYRGERSSSGIKHLAEISRKEDGIVLLVGEKDLKVFLRQAINGKSREAHIQDIFDQTVRSL